VGFDRAAAVSSYLSGALVIFESVPNPVLATLGYPLFSPPNKMYFSRDP